MSSHATATQAFHNLQSGGGGVSHQSTSVVGHHRGFSQPSAAIVDASGDPWFLQSTGHQMPPTAPLRHNKRPAPQPTAAANNTASSVANSGIPVARALHQQLSQSHAHIAAPCIPPHQNNVHPQVHLSTHALNSHNLLAPNTKSSKSQSSLTSQLVAANLDIAQASSSPQQQQQQTYHPYQHNLSASHVHAAGASASTAPSSLAATKQQHLQLLSSNNCNINNNNTQMSSSLHSGVIGVPVAGTRTAVGVDRVDSFVMPQRGAQAGSLHGSNMLLHASLQQQQTTNTAHAASAAAVGTQGLSANTAMSTSLHGFELNGCIGNWSSNSATANSISPTAATAGTNHLGLQAQQQHLQQQQQQLQQQQHHRKCEVKLNAMPWFHGSITRDEAEHLLQPREDGLFLVRESTNFPGDYTLCVCFQGKVEHYRVKYLEHKLTIDDEEYFETLNQLVAHYEADADGLCTQLIKCLPKMGKQEFCINSKDFVDKGWVIPEADLQLCESIGKGEFGDVLLGILRQEKVAVKMLKDEGAVQKFLAEASVMTTLEHENLVKFIGLVFSSKHLYLVTEYMSKGSLVDYLRSRGRQHITKKDQINFAYDTASGMEYLEAKKVVHRDLAARNVLISEECVAKVSDFGLAREECYNLEVGKLPIKWTAPEALKNGRFSNKSDMWSFGILLWEIYSFGRVPYPRIPLADVVKHVEVGYKMEAPEGCPAEIYEMMRQAWDLNPSKRPTFAEVKIKLLHLKNITT